MGWLNRVYARRNGVAPSWKVDRVQHSLIGGRPLMRARADRRLSLDSASTAYFAHFRAEVAAQLRPSSRGAMCSMASRRMAANAECPPSSFEARPSGRAPQDEGSW